MSNDGFWTTTLDNGLRVVVEEIPRLSSTAAGFLARTGSRDEPREIAGMSHFLEHMCFKGTMKRTWDRILKDIDGLGALWNAFTGWEETAYYQWVQAPRAEAAVEILADMMRPRLAEEDFNMEKKVILEEIAMYEDNPSALIFDKLIQTAFGDHPLGISVLGTAESVTRISHADMSGYFRRRYSPDNMAFIATGRVDRDRLVDAVRTHTSDWKASGGGRGQPPPPFLGARKVFHRQRDAREHIALAWRGPATGSEWQAAAAVLAVYLGDSENSRLYWGIKQQGLVDHISAFAHDFTDSGFLGVYASASQEKAEEVVRRTRAEAAEAHAKVDEAALGRSRTKVASALVRSAEHGLSRWHQIVERERAGAAPKSVEAMVAEVDAVTPERLRGYLERFPLTGEPAMVMMGPMEG
jgi:predicted Zn-dependent peptidase